MVYNEGSGRVKPGQGVREDPRAGHFLITARKRECSLRRPKMTAGYFLEARTGLPSLLFHSPLLSKWSSNGGSGAKKRVQAGSLLAAWLSHHLSSLQVSALGIKKGPVSERDDPAGTGLMTRMKTNAKTHSMRETSVVPPPLSAKKLTILLTGR